MGSGAIWHLHLINFLKKLLSRTSHAPACGRHPPPLGGACDASRWKNIACQGSDVRCILSFPLWWWGALLHLMHGWAPTTCFLCPLFYFSSALKNVLLLQKIKRVCYLLSLSYLILFLLVVSNYIYFFNCMLWHLIFISNLVFLLCFFR
jgi:hypothetical protein